MNPKVLVVEDFAPIRNMYTEVLQRVGVDIVTAEDGKDALRLINTESPDVIILDVDLPYMSGLEVLERLRSNPQTKEKKVIIVTGNRVIEHNTSMPDADLVLVKPVSLIDLVNFVSRFLPA